MSILTAKKILQLQDNCKNPQSAEFSLGASAYFVHHFQTVLLNIERYAAIFPN
jgi:hypothetical protein